VAPDLHSKYADLADLEVAIVHYWFLTWRGGEKVIRSLMDLFPKADIYTLFYDEAACGRYLAGHQVHSSALNLPLFRSRHQKVFPLYPAGVKSLNLEKKYDLILSSESGPAKGIRRGSLNRKTPHLCYVHSPMRYCYGFEDVYVKELPLLVRPLVRNQLARLREWDQTTLDNVDLYVANSVNVQERIKKFWHKESQVVFPPIALSLFDQPPKSPGGEHYIYFGALTPYKNVSVLIDAFNHNGKPLVVVGEGSERAKLQARAAENICFMGYQEISEVEILLTSARALLFPPEEDFGMIPLEAMAKGLPVIALKAGGALETVVENRSTPDKSSGIFFLRPDAREVNQAIEDFETLEYRFDPLWIQSHARQFGEDLFQGHMARLLRQFLHLHP